MTRIPCAHYLTEVRYGGGQVFAGPEIPRQQVGVFGGSDGAEPVQFLENYVFAVKRNNVRVPGQQRVQEAGPAPGGGVYDKDVLHVARPAGVEPVRVVPAVNIAALLRNIAEGAGPDGLVGSFDHYGAGRGAGRRCAALSADCPVR